MLANYLRMLKEKYNESGIIKFVRGSHRNYQPNYGKTNGQSKLSNRL